MIDSAKLQRTLDALPQGKKAFANLVQLVRDLMCQDPSGAVTNGDLVAVARGDMLRSGKDESGVFPLDHDKQNRFAKYRTTVEQLVGIARRNEVLAFALDAPLRQIDNSLRNITGFCFDSPEGAPTSIFHDMDGIRAIALTHIAKMTEIKRAGPKNLWKVALKRAKRGDDWAYKGQGSPIEGVSPESDEGRANWYGTRSVTLAEVVDLLRVETTGNRPLERNQANKMLFILAMSDNWWVTAPVHSSDSDSRPHITVFIAPGGSGDQFHLYVHETHRGDFRLVGHITHGKQGLQL